jgi:phage tail protein X
MGNSKTYPTVYGDTFDLISYKVFGTEAYRSNFVDANPSYSSAYVFESGVIIQIPVITKRKTMNPVPW